ncbi:carbohydrate ABC transporter permease [Paenibacillus radicis (ex Xue et al. 2023)]|uniref:Carbohydrate ABC transporter permease n=1 Tax=Paenibacillus radicis (ex Xue et al. 2023) TaxID=2972489 RepID=A0ABT1YKX6_9BACL|nr:carbohydrate ABC transporter permease [Paenibacillus radicis (ex Xue et al. 2023)]MCR8633842.1 carbohydrate ABC transporter permease [Paenibacillus radicis (ex Xue et al. 2023)]
MSKGKSNSAFFFCIHLIIACLVLLPLLFALVSSFRPLTEIFRYVSPFSWRTFIPTELTFDAYTSLFTARGFGRIFLNTFLVTFVTVIVGVFINSMAAFAFSKFEFRGKNTLFLLVLVTFMIPFEVIAIPLYNLVDHLGWIDTYWGLIVPGLANGLVIFLFRQFFMDMPTMLLESAHLDGASWSTIYTKIVMPLSKPVTISAGLLLFLFQWESFLWPVIATRSKQYKVIQVAMSDFVTEHATFWNEMFAACTLAVLVPVLVLLPLQKYFVQGVTGTGIKE